MRTRGGANVADFRKAAEFRSLKAQHQALVLTPKCTGDNCCLLLTKVRILARTL